MDLNRLHPLDGCLHGKAYEGAGSLQGLHCSHCSRAGWLASLPPLFCIWTSLSPWYLPFALAKSIERFCLLALCFAFKIFSFVVCPLLTHLRRTSRLATNSPIIQAVFGHSNSAISTFQVYYNSQGLAHKLLLNAEGRRWKKQPYRLKKTKAL